MTAESSVEDVGSIVSSFSFFAEDPPLFPDGSPTSPSSARATSLSSSSLLLLLVVVVVVVVVVVAVVGVLFVYVFV